MLKPEELIIIEQFIDPEYYDVGLLLKYLDEHDVIGNEIFRICDKNKWAEILNGSTYSHYLDGKYGYIPVPKSTFINRIPFYFYLEDDRDIEGKTSFSFDLLLGSNFHEEKDNKRGHSIISRTPEHLEQFYRSLEYIFYELNIPLQEAFHYCQEQSHYNDGKIFTKWIHYLQLCEALKENNFFPDRFISSYNEILERSNLEPIIYEIEDTGIEGPYLRKGNLIIFSGTFPCDDKGFPILKWINLKINNATILSCSTQKSSSGEMIIKIEPDTEIYQLGSYYEEGRQVKYWHRIYAGPLLMELCRDELKTRREELGYTQQQVADAVGTSVRTYQKWEYGETTPDGLYLMRLINWLDITSMQDLIKIEVY